MPGRAEEMTGFISWPGTNKGDPEMSTEQIVRLDSTERHSIENRMRLEAQEKDIGQAYRRIEKIEEKLDRLTAKVIQTGAFISIAIPALTFLLNSMLSK